MNTDFVANPVAHTLPTAKEGDKVGLKISASAERFHTLVKGTVTAVGTKNIEIEIYELCDWISKERIGKSEIAEHKYWHYIGKTIPITPEQIHIMGV
jgi:hypothetical protein